MSGPDKDGLERETGLEPATSSLGSQAFVKSKSLARFCCEFLNLQRLAESAFSKPVGLNQGTNETGFLLASLGIRAAQINRTRLGNQDYLD